MSSWASDFVRFNIAFIENKVLVTEHIFGFIFINLLTNMVKHHVSIHSVASHMVMLALICTDCFFFLGSMVYIRVLYYLFYVVYFFWRCQIDLTDFHSELMLLLHHCFNLCRIALTNNPYSVRVSQTPAIRVVIICCMPFKKVIVVDKNKLSLWILLTMMKWDAFVKSGYQFVYCVWTFLFCHLVRDFQFSSEICIFVILLSICRNENSVLLS